MASAVPSDPQLVTALEHIAFLGDELQAARRSIADLTLALQSNREIGAAIGIVMVTHGVEAEEAFALLRRASQSRHTKLRELAREVVALRRLDPASPAIG